MKVISPEKEGMPRSHCVDTADGHISYPHVIQTHVINQHLTWPRYQTILHYIRI